MDVDRDVGREISDSECWENARDLVIKTYRFVSNGGLNSDRELKQALIRTTISIMSSLAVAGEQTYPKESMRHLGCALECVTTFRTYLVIIRELGFIGEGQFLDFEDQSVHISALINDCIKIGEKKRE
ncbi:MAG: four helix bundle protein [Acidobacteriota bacterium]